MVLIFGKDSCPYTEAAREEYERRRVPFEYLNVKKDKAALARMLEFSGGQRRVPVIVENGDVTIGFAGGT
jgi:glutaredoxin